MGLAVAAFAEALKSSPYVDSSVLEVIAPIIEEQSGRDEERAEFAELFASSRAAVAELLDNRWYRWELAAPVLTVDGKSAAPGRGRPDALVVDPLHGVASVYAAGSKRLSAEGAA